MTISVDIENSLDKTQQLFLVQTLKKIGTDNYFLSIIKYIYNIQYMLYIII